MGVRSQTFIKMLRKVQKQRIVMLFLFVIFTVVLLAIYKNFSIGAYRSAPDASCVGTGASLLVPLPPIYELAAKEPIIVTATLEQQIKDGYRFKVVESLKGNQLNKGDIIDVCVNLGQVSKDSSYRPALLFLKGIDKDRRLWVPTQAEMSVIPSINNSTFRLWPANDNQIYSLDEIRRVINNK